MKTFDIYPRWPMLFHEIDLMFSLYLQRRANLILKKSNVAASRIRRSEREQFSFLKENSSHTSFTKTRPKNLKCNNSRHLSPTWLKRLATFFLNRNRKFKNNA